ncbi:MAG: SPFH domain-containing protein, partial [Pararhodobacter sp.]
EVYFVNTRRFPGLKWGTQNPIMLRDPEFGALRLRAFGSYTIRVTDPARFMTEIVGTDGEFTQDEISGQIRNIVVQKVSQTLAASGIPALDMAANTKDLSKIVGEAIEPTLTEYGVSMPELYIENISLPPEVEKVLDQRSSMGIVGDLNKYTQFAAAQAMQQAAGASGDNAMGAGLGMGMGMGMAQQMANAMGGANAPAQQPAQQTAAPPPPPSASPEYHLAENGQTKGPFGTAQLQQMAGAGELTRETMVWTQGMAGWTKAGDVPALATLFAAMPPPPPPPAG